ncbi:MAG: DUF1232 domain-containing protein [Armatimonadetes bacterium]|nr:DUF1232 domain-containing protein [Armatimonadota bacterium]
MRLEQLFRGRGEPDRPPDPTMPLRFLIHLPNFVRLYWRLLHDKRVPLFPKALLVAAIAYAISPIDLLSDFSLPIIGVLDDVALLGLAIRYFIPLCPRNVVEEHVKLIDGGE